jgi:hypothetical protein
MLPANSRRSSRTTAIGKLRFWLQALSHSNNWRRRAGRLRCRLARLRLRTWSMFSSPGIGIDPDCFLLCRWSHSPCGHIPLDFTGGLPAGRHGKGPEKSILDRQMAPTRRRNADGLHTASWLAGTVEMSETDGRHAGAVRAGSGKRSSLDLCAAANSPLPDRRASSAVLIRKEAQPSIATAMKAPAGPSVWLT